MSRLLVNPGTPQAWEIALKHGTNRLGRGEKNDFQVNHPTVSTTHCEIVLSSAGVFLKDLGSTNGTFVNHAPVHEALLQSGQHVQLGAIDMVFEVDAPAAPPLPLSGAAFCKTHPRTAARFFCRTCQKYFCDLCVDTRQVDIELKRFCRTCGTECAPKQAHARPATTPSPKGFFARLPGAFAFPFRGSGLLMLLIGTVFFGLVGFLAAFSFFLSILFTGYLFAYMQNLIHATAAGDEASPGFPEVSNFLEDIVVPFLQLVGTVLVCFSPAIALAWWAAEGGGPGAVVATIVTTLLGCAYFPMAFLAVCILDSVTGANPLLVIPSIFRAPIEYAITVILLSAAFGVYEVGDLLLRLHFSVSIMTQSGTALLLMFGARVVSNFLWLYLLTVAMRLLGLFYLTKKDKLGWLDRH